MLKKFSVIFFLTLFLVLSLSTAYAAERHESSRFDMVRHVKVNLFQDNGVSDNDFGTGKVYLGAPISQSRGTRQLCDAATTRRDYQHNTSTGRQIAYAGYFNASCDYVFMIYTKTTQVGSSPLNYVDYSVFNWSSATHDWDVLNGCNAQISPNNSRYCNLDVAPNNGSPVAVYHWSADGTPNIWSYAGYGEITCPSYTFTEDSLPGAPNTANVQTGYCGDVDTEVSPYIWPKVDVGTDGSGNVVTHVAANEAGCGDPTVPADAIEVSSLIYYRKVETTAGEPWSGTWEGPIFMDSAYVISNLVRADKNGPNVYYVYLKPMYYYNGSTHPCEANGLGHYQQTNEVAYRQSTDYGASWGPVTYITDYSAEFENNGSEPAGDDISAMVDPDGNLHVVWVSSNRDPDDKCAMFYASKLWHWDSGNNCISMAYDGSHPAFFKGYLGSWNSPICKPNISWCDSTLYINFTRFGAHPVGDTSLEISEDVGQDSLFQAADIMIVASDADGSMGQTWTEGINLTNTNSTDCTAGDCFSETYSMMAMFSTDSLMIEYIEDKDNGAWLVGEGSMTENPVMFMTWPCFSMSDVGTNSCYTITPDPAEWHEIALAPNGNTSGCTTPATISDTVIVNNCGNVSLSYTASSDATWLTIGSASGTVSAGTGPRGLTNGCALPEEMIWTANSATLGQGNYPGTITVTLNPGGLSFDIVVNLVVACDYYLPEYATLTSGCWTVDVWNTPQAGNGADREAYEGNMKFYACGGDSTMHPLYTEAFIVGWNDGSVKCYTDQSAESYGFRMRALGSIDQGEVGNPSGGNGYYWTKGYWCTPDSLVHGMAEYIVPGHQDTSVLIEKITLWNESGSALNGFLVGEGIDWDVRTDSNFDEGGIDFARHMVYQRGANNPDFDSVVAGVAPYVGYDSNIGAAVLDNSHYIYPDTGYNVDTIYNYLTALDGQFTVFNDSLTDLNSVYRFYEGTLGVNDTLSFIKIKAVSTDGVTGLQALIDKGNVFITKNPGIYDAELVEPVSCITLTHHLPAKETAAEIFNVVDVNGKAVDWTGTIDDGGLGWLTVDVLSGTTPSAISVDYDAGVADGLAIGTYAGTITITAPGAVNSPMDVCVELEVKEAQTCVGLCGDANGDAAVNVSDAVWVINYVFVGGGAPLPVLACGDANGDAAVNVSDAVWIINYVFVGGGAPGDCAPGNWGGDDCCPFVK